jgi:4-amino-4-deoxy-L-arabinose transferase-like glycosyltransferase
MLLCLASVAVLFWNLGNSRFWDQDEGYYASVAAEMFSRGDWVVPTFNQELFAHKPPMMYWGMLAGFEVFGRNELGARWMSAFFGTLTVLLTYWLGKRIFDANTGLLAALALATSLMFTVVARSATADVHLAFFVLLSICIWSRDAFPATGVSQGIGSGVLQIRWSTWIAVYVSMGFAVLSKGPIGVAFPVTILGIVHWWEHVTIRLNESRDIEPLTRAQWLRVVLSPWNVVSCIAAMRPITAMIMVASVAGPWFVAMQRQTDGAFLSEFLGVHHLNRFSQPMDNHSGPFFYYIIACIVGLYPWTAFALPTAIAWFDKNAWCDSRRSHFLLSAWVVVYLGVFSIASTKLPNYVIPAYPALALIIGHYFASWSCSKDAWERRWQWIGWGGLVLIGLCLAIGPSFLTTPLGSNQTTVLDRFRIDSSMQSTIRWVSLLGIPLIAGGLVGYILLATRRHSWLTSCFAASSLGMMLIFWHIIVPLADRHQTPQDLATALNEQHQGVGRAGSIAVLNYFRPSMVYYAGQRIQFFNSIEEIVEQSKLDPPSVIVVQEQRVQELRELTSDRYQISDEFPEFPRRGKIVVLSRNDPLLKLSR